MSSHHTNWDTIIIGGGPAGASAATVLADQGRRTLVLERERFPRYHIGESLLPFTYGPLERLGLIPKMKQSCFVKKYSVQFVSPNGKASQPFYFFNRYDRETVAQTWQVLRSEFDQMLLDNARERGATVHEGSEVKELLKEGDRVVGVRVGQADGTEVEHRAPITIDCTGKEAFSTVRQGWRMKDPFLNKVAVWTYFEGAKRDEGVDEGATTVAFVPEKGWFWYIPQHNDRISVGVVAEGKYLSRDGVRSPEAMFRREVGQNVWLQDHLACGRQVGGYYITNEYSFHSRHCGCEGLLLAGDSFAFLDPVFSSGVMLALKSGVMAGDAVHQALAEGDFSPERFRPYAETIRRGVENMRKLVYAFYNPNFSFRQITDGHPEVVGYITDCLSGDVNKDFSALWDAIRPFAPLPDDLPCGMPLSAVEQLQGGVNAAV
ncbi:MAG: tryptophan 7-halogenase [Verrucomicrobia bacterium]|nr:tryptophan 7-halogenase [Verrucomicrobiota bacterium]MBI3868063.1 tryptophan 7-halogenase [Verrucomicrobiota bacterium]